MGNLNKGLEEFFGKEAYEVINKVLLFIAIGGLCFGIFLYAAGITDTIPIALIGAFMFFMAIILFVCMAIWKVIHRITQRQKKKERK